MSGSDNKFLKPSSSQSKTTQTRRSSFGSRKTCEPLLPCCFRFSAPFVENAFQKRSKSSIFDVARTISPPSLDVSWRYCDIAHAVSREGSALPAQIDFSTSHLEAVSLPLPPLQKSRLGPPLSASLPFWPSRLSLPLPPLRLSLPAPPQITSLPPSPESVSFPPRPAITSRPCVPVRTSLPLV